MPIYARHASRDTGSLKIIAIHAMTLIAQFATNPKTTVRHAFQGTALMAVDASLVRLTVPNVPSLLQLASNAKKAIN